MGAYSLLGETVAKPSNPGFTLVDYKLNKNITIGARYAFEHYRLNDFAWDILQPYIFPNTADNPTRFLLLDSRYSNYDVHVLGGFIRVQF